MKANNLDVKHVWVKKIRQLIQDTYFGTSTVSASLPSLRVPNQNENKSTKHTPSQRSSRDIDDVESLDESIELLEPGSVKSLDSGGSLDCDSNARLSRENAVGVDHTTICKEADTEALGNIKKLIDETLNIS